MGDGMPEYGRFEAERFTNGKVFRKYTVFLLAAVFAFLLTLAAGADRVRADYAYGYILPESSRSYLSYDEIEDMPVQAVCYAKNEIYARNGRMFLSEELQEYFNEQYWYCPVYTADEFSTEMLNVYETANVELLANRENELGGYALDSGSWDYSVVYQYISDSYYYYYGADDFYVDPDSYILYDSDIRYLTADDICQLTLQELCYARNEIYARRGRIFQSQELTDYFDQKNWYWGTIAPAAFSENLLNEYEKSNVAALQAEEYSRQSGGYILDQEGYSYALVGSYFSYESYVPSEQDYIFWDSNNRYLTDADVAGLSLQQLNYARNEIYARRGYIFQSQELRNYFESKHWYYGTIASGQFSTSVFNEYEQANVVFLKRWEYSLNPNGYQLY